MPQPSPARARGSSPTSSGSARRAPRCRCCCPTRAARRPSSAGGPRSPSRTASRRRPSGCGRGSTPPRPGATTDERHRAGETHRPPGRRTRRARGRGTIPLAVPEHRRARARVRRAGRRVGVRLVGRAVRRRVRGGLRPPGRRPVRRGVLVGHRRPPRRVPRPRGGAGRRGAVLRLHLRRLGEPHRLHGRATGARRLRALDLEPRPGPGRGRARPAGRGGGAPAGRRRGRARARPAGRPRARSSTRAPGTACRSSRTPPSRSGPGGRRGPWPAGRPGPSAASGRTRSTATRSRRPAAAGCSSPTTPTSPPGRATSPPRRRCPTSATSTTRSATTTASPTWPRRSAWPSSSGSTSSSTRKRAIAARYDEAIAGTGLVAPPRVDGLDATYWLYSVLVPADDPRGRDALPRSTSRRAAWGRGPCGGRCTTSRRMPVPSVLGDDDVAGRPLPPRGLPAVRDRADRGRPGAGRRRGAVVLRLTGCGPMRSVASGELSSGQGCRVGRRLRRGSGRDRSVYHAVPGAVTRADRRALRGRGHDPRRRGPVPREAPTGGHPAYRSVT